jgi:hypothetical protein
VAAGVVAMKQIIIKIFNVENNSILVGAGVVAGEK